METYSRAVEPEPSVTITDATFFGHGWQPLTIGVLQAIWFMPQGIDFRVEDLTTWFRKLGWKSGNGQPIGIDAVRRELALIRKAGYIQAVRVRGEHGRVEGVRYEVSKRVRPELDQVGPWIPIESTVSEKPSSDHVPSMAAHGGPGHMEQKRSRRSRHVPPSTAHGGRPNMVDAAKLQVAPCAPNGVHPPHPPEEVETSSPYPHKPAVPAEEAGERFTPEQIRDAERFLQLLPGPWAAGRKTAQRLAPKLLDAAAAQGWDLDDALATQLTEKPDGVHRYAAVLASRIDDLPLRAAVARTARPASVPVASVLPAWCADLDCDEDTRIRAVTDADGFVFSVPCPDCHPNTQTQEAA